LGRANRELPAGVLSRRADPGRGRSGHARGLDVHAGAGGDGRVVVEEAARKRAAALAAVGPFATQDPADVRWLLCGRGRPVSAGSSPYAVVVDEGRAQVLYQDIEASRVAAEERWEELGYEAVPHPWFEPPPDFATDCCLDELRLALGLEELDRYRAAGSDGADAFVAALGALRPELSDLGAAVLTACRPGATLGELFEVLARVYEEQGFRDEWRRHHQGGLTGYRGREVFAVPGDPTPLPEACAVAWNPSVTGGGKSEDTALVTAAGVEVITRTPGLAELETAAGLRRPAIVEL